MASRCVCFATLYRIPARGLDTITNYSYELVTIIFSRPMKTLVALSSALVLLTGCVGVNYQMGQPPVSDPNAYAPVEFAKLVSGAYTQELDQKLVSVRGKFNYAFSKDGRSLEGRIASVDPTVPGQLSVAFGEGLKDRVTALKTGDPVTLRGKVRAVQVTSGFGASWAGTYLEVYFIDP